MAIRFLNGKPALLISDKKFGKILVIADLHLGIEHELYNAGIVIAPQAEKFYKEIDKLLHFTKADKLIIIGDLKHKVPGISFRELREVPKLMEPLSKKIEISIARGNHDVEFGSDIIPESVEVHGSEGFSIGPYGFFHGHAWPARELLKCDYLFTAHIHPTVEFVDDFGFRLVEKVWVKGTLDEKIVRKKYRIKKDTRLGKLQTIIFPAFNPIISGVPLNSKRAKKDYIGPILSSGAFDIKKAEAYMLDGSALGKIRKIKSR